MFYYESNYELKFKSLDIIYPLIGYSEDSQQVQFNALFRLIKYSNFTNYDDINKKTFEIFPIVDIAWGSNEDDNHFSIFPLFGNIKNKYAKEKISYFIFPIYMKTYKKIRIIHIFYGLFSLQLLVNIVKALNFGPFMDRRQKLIPTI